MHVGYFQQHIVRAIKLAAAALKAEQDLFMSWASRKFGDVGSWNHGAHFDDCFTVIWDGFPLPVQKPTKWDGDAELVYSGKYKACVYKGHVGITFWGGIVACTGPHPGTWHDKKIWAMEQAMFPMEAGEMALGDLAYHSCEQVLTGRKHPRVGTNAVPWSEEDEFTRNLIAHYRSRVEIVIRRIKQPGWCQHIFRGSYELFVASFDITTLMAG